ncbi:MAG: hypothetical protein APG08_00813 [Candidatus Methanofastidiosum methylothiophilum]|jgi:hypothetical protein|uniref:LSM domain-containing protein n=1 Tax=Candidatus Methanofastidiosum methylothiophilum TaxID=1705564 RepID=A0A150JHF1_9EURY|nr:MAG: hypothetical protein AN188_01108 [Candidatus Methanofastidiosum methylthiophilus]MBP6932783.1 hypothetical protein [Methanofastidiosum sp.]OQC52103.1 MAG: hypothetical protein BWX56_00570 [Euryarchaeota archaeon ADurb.Bin023]KYC56669.1 MAG: hypothetical protein APG08_00813 [Candidatus Methanofastidiosum methylthiophilus]KYC58394.1 MAG: hypothetical protein APG09_00416 [Candidatus Methanofastidiosum methylthiophilus]
MFNSGGTLSKLLLKKLEYYDGKKLVVSIDGSIFKGKLIDFDEDMLCLGDVTDIGGSTGKELIVSLSNVVWIILAEDNK